MKGIKNMKFKTVVITKKMLFAVLCLSIIGAVCGVGVRLISRKAVNAVNEISYEDILSEALPDSNEKTFDIKEIISKITGIDTKFPETIISEYSPVFEGTNLTEESIVTETEQPVDDMPEPTDEPAGLPDKTAICSSVGLKVNNATQYDVDVDALCGEELPFEINSDGPQVLVVHTHTTECYDGDQMNGETERNTDEQCNVIAVGEEICKVLEENGIKTVHDKTYHDYPSYQGSYTRALSTIETQLKNNPSIKIVLDIHRDAFIYEDGSKLTVTCDQNGVSTAKVMLVVGTNSMGLWHDNWKDNLTFAAKIQNAAEIMYSGLMRPINIRTERFNEHTTRGSLILEVGSNGNTLEQAKEGGRDVAYAISAVLNAK